jgi:hypothetical protein
MANRLELNKEYPVDIIEKFLLAAGVDTSILDGDEFDDEPIEIGMSLTFRFDDHTIAATVIMTGYTSMAIYKIAYLAPTFTQVAEKK